MYEHDEHEGVGQRRGFIATIASMAGIGVLGCGAREGAEESPGEDLMQEHGLVERLLLVYDESAHRLEQGTPFDLTVLTRAVELFQHFVEDHHERTEEQLVFPRLQSAGREIALVATLLRQHERGRALTLQLLSQSRAGALGQLAPTLRAFTRMYRPHAAREDTVLFPAFRALHTKAQYAELGERFERDEREHLGEHGFERAVEQVARLEAELGIGDLASFTPG